jgi:UDP-N-acetylglucosamine--N-acetylmuramyl-(pentapeptide) pyrophosphoryl-undecaprenol N-acetylglucosamine transferase
MKIVFTGGGSGGHFYPIIALAEQVNKIIDRDKIVQAKLYYFSDAPYDKVALFDNGITYKQISAGKMRLYFSLSNFFDMFKIFVGVVQAYLALFAIFPDVVVGKGGYASFPTLLAARLLRIPVIIHESDSYPGRTNIWAGKFAKRIAVSFPEAAQYFPKDRVAYTGHPIRGEIAESQKNGAFEFFNMDPAIPLVFIIGGSLGAQVINDAVIDSLQLLLPKYQIIHQTGMKNFEEVKRTSEIVMQDKKELLKHYLPKGYMNNLELKMAAGAASVIISRGGSMIFEIASWGVPSIIIPITKSNGDHQRKNAYTYAAAGGGEVIEEANLTGSVLASELDRLISHPEFIKTMQDQAKKFTVPDAGAKIAEQIVQIALSHEK